MNKIIKYVIVDILRNKIVIAYTLCLLLLSMGLFSLEDNSDKALVSLMSIVLFLVPLINLIFSAIYVYNSNEFIELLAAQPIQRKTLWISIFCGLACSLSLAFIIGCGIPIFLFSGSEVGISLLLMGIFLSVIFIAIALLAAVYNRDKAKGIGLSILIWIYFAIVFDALVLFVLFQFMDYPMENTLVVLSMLNPIDLARVFLLIKIDVSALMGATSAVFKNAFGSLKGLALTVSVMTVWVALPLYISLRAFIKKNL
ncbi:MAG TPA: ABC transporter permease [Candidatus Sphingobacterium stercoripullorum]|uniref:ABC transporter permease n=1 Tax=Candidatus Sphingobacterium stercoripullorum TaxID=2838759 RepID=A0A9D1WAE9_9SPHI|nr:ABC transporter permease [Candidatus Sphingobacterium stercoripullorum]